MNIKAFLEIAIPPANQDMAWLEGAETAVHFLVRNVRSDEVILFSNVGETYVNAVLILQANIATKTIEKLEHAYIDPMGQWSITHVSGGGKPDRVYLSDPLSERCPELSGGEQLVFRRQFVGVDKGPPRTEINQRLVQALDLYYLEERSSFCRLDENGDIEPIIRIYDLSKSASQQSATLVTIKAAQLHRYMAVTESALGVKFDFTRFRSSSFFGGWHDAERGQQTNADISYHTGKQVGASFVNGALIMHPTLTKQMVIDRNNRDWSDIGKQYASFVAYDWKNDEVKEVSCSPNELASYFEHDSPLPFQITPAFFRAEVLLKYKSDPEKYSLEHRSIRSRSGWYLKSYDVNEEGQVHTYLCDLSRLPYSEQIYWRSFNEPPKGGISKRAFETDIEGRFSSVADPLLELKSEIRRLDKVAPLWWKPRGEAAAQAVHYPITASTEEWSNAILALDQLVVEGFIERGLRKKLELEGRDPEGAWKSLRLLQEWLECTGSTVEEAIATLEPLKRTHFLRSKAKGHLAETEKQALVKAAIHENGSLSVHFYKLVADIQTSFDLIIERLS